MIAAGSHNAFDGSRREETGTERRRNLSADAGRGGDPERVLFVDDEPLIRRLCRAMLPTLGFDVRVCTSGREALAALETAEKPFDVVLSDVKMPAMDGVELSRAIFDRWPGLPVLLCSGFADSELIKTALQEGVEEFVAKPFTAEEIGQALRRVLNRRSVAAP